MGDVVRMIVEQRAAPWGLIVIILQQLPVLDGPFLFIDRFIEDLDHYQTHFVGFITHFKCDPGGREAHGAFPHISHS